MLNITHMHSGVIRSQPDAGNEGADFTILCPHFRGLEPELADLAALLPVRGINAELITQAPASASDGTPCYGGVLAVDPFVTGAPLFRAVKRRGFTGLVNMPTIAFAESEFRRALQAGGMDYAHEIEFLAEARAHGLDAIALVFSVDQAMQAAEAGIERVMVHPGLIGRDPAARRQLCDGVAAVIRKLKAQTPALTVLLYRHAALKPLLDEASACADGEVVWDVAPIGDQSSA